MEGIRMRAIKWGKRNVLTRSFWHAKDNKKAIAAWKSDLDQIRRVFEVSLFTFVCTRITNFRLPDRTCRERGCRRPRASSEHFEYS